MQQTGVWGTRNWVNKTGQTRGCQPKAAQNYGLFMHDFGLYLCRPITESTNPFELWDLDLYGLCIDLLKSVHIT